jgi:hypothetical protein
MGGLTPDLVLTGTHLRHRSTAGRRIGAHTASHPKLAELQDGVAMHKIAEARDIVRDHLPVEAKHFFTPMVLPQRSPVDF